MLSSETKRKIDNARDILVGKIPVPSAQIELITIALIYKFMSDIDTQNKELGADGFFVGEYQKYAWSNIMDRKIGAHDRLYLYSEGLDKMGTNPHLPQMFRDIFRNAFLPFKDPQTLDRFLKQINEFSYDHSEELGNAFEYLLSTAGSQGDAGQFRTPRHIIDFIVQVVEPKHTDTILDPACGTAGFLISAYKYIMGQNQDKTPGDKLTLAQKNMLTKNFVGYDISHEMVRLSLVNMYLHNFGDPHIYEYDTLSSDERRDDRFDCILANPPFMTPKGGIQPHSRFSIKASKSEVLFVDYMMEHLNPHGKAGIIIPEGIIFQSANAYKSLRKKMIEENYLRAVVSLPSGIFQPYAGVKTSILLFDRELAKKSQNILFVKVNQDGYDLGAQRRPTPDKDDLPKVLEILQNIKTKIHNREIVELDTPYALLVPKVEIIANGDYNLSVERYRVAELMNSDWSMVELGDLIETITPPIKIQKSELLEKGLFPVIDQGQDFITGYTNNKEAIINLTKPLIIFGDHTCAVKYIDFNFVQGSDGIKIIQTKEELNPKYLYYCLKTKPIQSDGYKRHFGKLKLFKIPLPPLEVQEQIVAELDGYQKIIDGAKQIIENYKPTIKIDPDWEMVELGDENIFKIESGGTPDSKNKLYRNGNINWATLVDLPQEDYVTFLKNTERKITEEGLKNSSAKLLPPKTIIVSSRATIGRVGILLSKAATNQGYKNVIIKDFLRVDEVYIAYILRTMKNKFMSLASGGTFSEISKTNFCTLKIPLPPIETQQQIVAEIEKEQAMVQSAKGLIEVFEGKVKEKIGEVWGE